MTEGLVARCKPFSCIKDKHINKFFHEEYSDYEYQMLGKTYCFVTREEQKIVAAFSIANSSVRVDNMPKSKRNKLNRKIPFSKQRSQYPAVLVAQLAVFDDFGGNDHGVGSSDHFQESVILIMIHYCLNSHIICLDK